MIASFTNDFIFIKTRKTGGTSAEIVLSSWCSPPDICSRISKEDEITRAVYGGMAPTANYNGHRVYNHMPASEIREAFPDLWSRAFKFTIERHPYEKAISRVYWKIGRKGGDPAAEFDAELADVLGTSLFIDRDLYMIDGGIAVDEIVPHDRLWVRMAELAERFGRKLPASLPTAKSRHRTDRRQAAEILSADQKRAIQNAAAFEFQTFGFAA